MHRPTRRFDFLLALSSSLALMCSAVTGAASMAWAADGASLNAGTVADATAGAGADGSTGAGADASKGAGAGNSGGAPAGVGATTALTSSSSPTSSSSLTTSSSPTTSSSLTTSSSPIASPSPLTSPSLPPVTEPPRVAAPSPLQAALASSTPLGPSTIADIAQSVAPSVVSFDVDQKTAQAGTRDYPMNPFQFFFNGLKVTPDGQGGFVPSRREPVRTSKGSGFIIRPDGYIVTNAHVVKSAGKVTVNLNDGRHFPGTVLGSDPYTDIAVVKIDADKLPIARLGTTKGLRPGDFCIAIGSPYGYDHTVTFGIISALERDVRSVNEHVHFIQTDAAINLGNSGGPLLNLAGEVIGINTAIHAVGQNLAFSIPIDTVKSVIESLVAHKRIERPFLGIGMDPLDDITRKGLGLDASTRGVFIKDVYPGPAQIAGIVKGDVVQKIDGADVTTPKDVQDVVHLHKVGDKIHLMILRHSQLQALACEVGQYPETEVFAGAGNGLEDEP